MSIIKLGTGGVIKFGTTNAVIKMSDGNPPPWQLSLTATDLFHVQLSHSIDWEVYNSNPVNCRAYYAVYKDWEPTVIDSGFVFVGSNDSGFHTTNGVASSYYQIAWYLVSYPADPDWTQSPTVVDGHQL